MAKRFTSGAFAPSTVTEEERVAAGEAAAQAQQVDTQPGSVVLPTEQIEDRVPSADTTVSTEALESTDTPNIGFRSLADAVFESQQRTQQAAANPIGQDPRRSAAVQAGLQDPRAIELPAARGEPSPQASEVQGVQVPIAGAPADVGQFESEFEREQRYRTEQARQAKPSYDQVFDSITGLGTDSEATFNSAATDVALRLQREASSNLRVAETLQAAGVFDPTTGTVDNHAARALVFTMATKAARVEEDKSASVAEIQQQLLAGEITESDLDDKVKHAVLTPDFDRQNLQSSFASEFQSLFGDSLGIDEDLRIDNPQAIQSGLAPQDQSVLAVTMGKILQDMGFVRQSFREVNGKTRAGYDIEDNFVDLMISIAPVLEDYNQSFRKGVTFTPNIGGVP